jgi:hypothetical protein
MTPRKRHQRTALRLSLLSVQTRLQAAMREANYEAALAYQVQIHDLERRLHYLSDPLLFSSIGRPLVGATRDSVR